MMIEYKNSYCRYPRLHHSAKSPWSQLTNFFLSSVCFSSNDLELMSVPSFFAFLKLPGKFSVCILYLLLFLWATIYSWIVWLSLYSWGYLPWELALLILKTRNGMREQGNKRELLIRYMCQVTRIRLHSVSRMISLNFIPEFICTNKEYKSSGTMIIQFYMTSHTDEYVSNKQQPVSKIRSTVYLSQGSWFIPIL